MEFRGHEEIRGRSRDTPQFSTYQMRPWNLRPRRARARLVIEISHRSYVFEIGKIALSAESKSLSEDARIKRAYLGA